MAWDVIVIGGGPAGLMASIAAREQGASVLLIDKGNKLGRKLAISGGGRCNVTNRMEEQQLIEHIPGNGRFMYSPFSVFNNEDIIHFFERLGIRLKEEDHGRMFPVDDKAVTVVRTLLDQIHRLGVSIRKNTRVIDIDYSDDQTAVEAVHIEGGERLETNAVIIATGGKSVPHTGSTGDGYPWVEKAGHKVTELYPTEVPLTSRDQLIKSKKLQGLSLREVKLSVIDPKKNKPLISHVGDMIFTHFGFSGPIALRCSQFVVKALKKHHVQDVNLLLDVFPSQSNNALIDQLRSLLEQEPKKAIRNIWKSFVPERLLDAILEQQEIDPYHTVSTLSKQDLERFANTLKSLPLSTNGTLPIDKAFVTGGGISTKEVDPKRMASKWIQGLHFCGEVMDIHGYTGGYNITVAFSTGFTAGKAAGEESQYNNH
ncbi:NAD(P)/FAD-dependent oxidoreductase [Texcoconibacillus texcoconensis]|uniref:NAD(P)/FAD-dependent oxidoreductase n=1 Tax=Texcoconibacillus texcoconensis TaxID=1095777 RepID=A0A840QNA0_9BACI|nr:NAD(P)/FAD-dependent oxidoreductase [Texcoconibacillus texcoconensis]MBB5172811.1 hypothetical protein [Texcoconibacillus texcoconensis]